MANTLILSYKRVEGDLSTGNLVVQQGSDATTFATFDRMGFASMISLLSGLLRSHPEARVVFQRTDRHGLLPVQLEQSLVTQIREDPARAVKAMTWEQPATKKVEKKS